MEKSLDKLMNTGFKFSKGLGQNFITDVNLLCSIVNDSGVTKDDIVVEVGAGAGTLTEQIAQKAKKVVSIEIDNSLKEYLSDKFNGSNVQLIFGDILKTKKEVIVQATEGKSFKVIANIPYYITSPVIFYFLDGDFNISSLTLMVQKEVADRVVCKKGKDYGAISANIQCRAEAQILRTVSRKLFTPPPNVDSAVLKITPKYRNDVANYTQLFALIKAAFSMRRKTLLNCLGGAGINKTVAQDVLIEAGFEPTIRGETLSVEDFIKLSNFMQDKFVLFAQ